MLGGVTRCAPYDRCDRFVQARNTLQTLQSLRHLLSRHTSRSAGTRRRRTRRTCRPIHVALFSLGVAWTVLWLYLAWIGFCVVVLPYMPKTVQHRVGDVVSIVKVCRGVRNMMHGRWVVCDRTRETTLSDAFPLGCY